MSKYLDAAYAVLQEAGEPLSAADIVDRASETGRITTKGKTPSTTMGAMLYTDIAHGRSRFAKHGPGLFELSGAGEAPVKEDISDGEVDSANGATGGTSDDSGKQAERALSRDVWQDSQEIDDPSGSDYQRRIGAAGEFRVMSELLLRGYSADHITIDNGIDIRATKDKSVYEIQVKTVTELKAGRKFVITIRKEAFERVSDSRVYYIFVLRNRHNGIVYVTVSNKEMKNRIKDGNITENEAGYQVQFSIKDGSLFMRKKNVDEFVNDWDL